MAEIPPEVRTELEQHPWEETIPRLELYALRKARRLYWQGIMDGNMPTGQEAADVVLEAIEDLLTGKRSWDPSIQPNLFAHLRSIIDSKLSHLVESWANRHVRTESALSTEDNNATGSPSPHVQFSEPTPSPAEMMLRAEEERLAEEFFWGFYEYLSDEPLLQKVIECIDDDLKPAEMAAHLGVPQKEIYNIRKRLQRRLADYRAQCGQKPLPGKGGKIHG
jgi:DNA-directed RNA polymerase specialized sigma24 family protein